MEKKHINILLTFLNLKGIGPSFIGANAQKILKSYNDDENFESTLSAISKKEYSEDEIAEAKQGATLIQDICKKNAIKITSLYDSDYPTILENYKSKFPIFYSMGDLRLTKTIGVIGSRNAREVSSKIASRIGEFCVQNQIGLLNGIADGIDMMSIQASGTVKNAIGIVPGGLAFDEYDTLNKAYLKNAKQVLHGGGCLVSQFSPFLKQDQYKVVEYCKLQAAMSDALVLVQSSIDGGSKFTVEHFCQEAKTLFVVNANSYDNNEVEYSANNLIIEKRQAGIAEWCNLKLNKIKCKIEIINSKEDYYKFLSLDIIKDNNPKLF